MRDKKHFRMCTTLAHFDIFKNFIDYAWLIVMEISPDDEIVTELPRNFCIDFGYCPNLFKFKYDSITSNFLMDLKFAALQG